MRRKLILGAAVLPVLMSNLATVLAADQKTVSGTLSGDISYVVTNNKEAIIPTGITTGILPVIVIGIIAVTAFLITKKRRTVS